MRLGALRDRIARGAAAITVDALRASDLAEIGWSGSASHLENVARQLERVVSGEVEYLVVRADGVVVAKGGIDYAVEPGAGTIWQVATHPELEGLGLATRLFRDAEQRIAARALRTIRLGVEVDNDRARRLYEHLGFNACGETPEEWVAEDAAGRRVLYRTTCTQMVKHLPASAP